MWRLRDAKTRIALILPYVKSLGMLPTGLVRRLDAAFRTGTPADKHSATGLIDALAQDAPEAFGDLHHVRLPREALE